MRATGLKGNMSVIAFSVAVLLIVLPFAYKEAGGIANISFANVKWTLVIAAGVFGAIGIMNFNGMLAKSTTESAPALLVLSVTAQIVVPASYKIITDLIEKGSMPPMVRIAGFVSAILTAYLLTKKV